MAEQVLREPSPLMPIDVVDRLDRKIGEIPRADVLDAGAAFHTVHLFLFDRTGRLLLQQLHPSRERHPLCWGASVAAYLFAGETYEDAIRRRAMQELGIQVHPEFAGKVAMQDDASLKFVGLFETEYEGELTIDRTHIADVEYREIDSIASELRENPERFTPTFRELFAFYTRSHRG